MTAVSTPVAMKQGTYIGPDVWTAPVVGAIVYPLLVKGFILTVHSYQANDDVTPKVVLAAAALVFMAAELAVPFVAFRALLAIRNSIEPNAPLIRRVLHVVFATPPLITVTGFATSALGVPLTWAWYGGWGLVAMIAFRAQGLEQQLPHHLARLDAAAKDSWLFSLVSPVGFFGAASG